MVVVFILIKMIFMLVGKLDEFVGLFFGADRFVFSYLVLGAFCGWGDVNGDGCIIV